MRPTESTCCNGTQSCNLPFPIGRRDQTFAFTGGCGNYGHSPIDCECGCCEGPGDILSTYNPAPADYAVNPNCSPF